MTRVESKVSLDWQFLKNSDNSEKHCIYAYLQGDQILYVGVSNGKSLRECWSSRDKALLQNLAQQPDRVKVIYAALDKPSLLQKIKAILLFEETPPANQDTINLPDDLGLICNGPWPGKSEYWV